MSQIQENTLDALLLRYPGLIAEEYSSKGTKIEGALKIDGQRFRILLSCPHFPQIENMNLQVTVLEEVKQFTTHAESVNPKWTVHELLRNLPNLMPKYETLDAVAHVTNHVDQPTQNIFAEIASLYNPNDYSMQINESATRVRFYKFSYFEQHYLELNLPNLQLIAHSLPDCVPWQEHLQNCTTLTALVRQFQKFLEELQPFYENFTDIDELCYVLQPAPATSKHNWRLFVLRQRVFIKLVIADPFAPIASMSVHILGPTYEVEQLRRTYSEGLSNWDAELDIHKNLLRIFDLCYFPMPPGYGEEDLLEDQFCNICYGRQLDDGDVPIISCDNTHCSLIFHASCLMKWFHTLSDGKVFLDVSFGQCPFCKAKLSTSFAALLKN